MTEQDLSNYRPNVGIVLFNRAGEVWLGRRLNARPPLNWQFPQGGVDPGEDWEAAARRELYEETGARTLEKLGQTHDWIVYDFPPEAFGRKIAMGYRGQKQKWFAFRFLGEDTEFDLRLHRPQEFNAWRWAAIEDALESVASFKREAYEKVIAAFRDLAG